MSVGVDEVDGVAVDVAVAVEGEGVRSDRDGGGGVGPAVRVGGGESGAGGVVEPRAHLVLAGGGVSPRAGVEGFVASVSSGVADALGIQRCGPEGRAEGVEAGGAGGEACLADDGCGIACAVVEEKLVGRGRSDVDRFRVRRRVEDVDGFDAAASGPEVRELLGAEAVVAKVGGGRGDADGGFAALALPVESVVAEVDGEGRGPPASGVGSEDLSGGAVEAVVAVGGAAVGGEPAGGVVARVVRGRRSGGVDDVLRLSSAL